MPRFEFHSPGAAASNELTRILAEREAQKRQEFLDSITLKRENRNDEIQRESLKSIQDQRASINEQRQQTMATGLVPFLKPGQRLDADTSGTLKQGNLGILVKGNQQFKPEGDTETGGTMDVADQFTGTPDQSKALKQKEELQRFLDDPNTPPAVKQALQYEQSTGKAAPAGMFEKNHTGMVGEYEYYVEQEKAAGRTPKTFSEYQDADANRKKVDTGEGTLQLTGPALDMAAKMYAKTGTLPSMGMGKAGAAIRERVLNRAAQYDPSTDAFSVDAPVPDIAGAKAGFQADQGSLVSLQKNLDAVSAFMKTADKNAELLKDVMEKIPNTGIPLLNMPVRLISKNVFGNENMAALDSIRQAVQNEYARIISQPNLAGALSDSARKEMEVVLDGNSTPHQILAALNQLHAEGQNRVKTYEEQRADIKKRIKGGPKEPAGGATPAVVAPAAPDPNALRQKYNY